MTPEDMQKLEEISKLLDEAYAHYFEYEGHCKSSEGHIEVAFGNIWDRKEKGLAIEYVNIYSYVFCRQGRSQLFESIDEALETVRQWHEDEMAYDYNAPEAVEAREEFDKLAVDWINQMQEDGRLHVHIVGEDDGL